MLRIKMAPATLSECLAAGWHVRGSRSSADGTRGLGGCKGAAQRKEEASSEGLTAGRISGCEGHQETRSKDEHTHSPACSRSFTVCRQRARSACVGQSNQFYVSLRSRLKQCVHESLPAHMLSSLLLRCDPVGSSLLRQSCYAPGACLGSLCLRPSWARPTVWASAHSHLVPSKNVDRLC